MSDDGKARQTEAGARNLADWKKNNPTGANLRHGVYSVHLRKRYTDGRTREGKQLAALMDDLIEDLGGKAALRTGQLIILDRVREKLIILAQMGGALDKLQGVVMPPDDKGGRGLELVPFLRYGYTTYSECLRRDIELLYALCDRKAARGLDLAGYLRARKRNSDEAAAQLGDGGAS
jgi:hypothetical protein